MGEEVEKAGQNYVFSLCRQIHTKVFHSKKEFQEFIMFCVSCRYRVQ